METFESLLKDLKKGLGNVVDNDLIPALTHHKETSVLNSFEVKEMGCKVNLFQFRRMYIVSTFLPLELPEEVDSDGAGGGELIFLTTASDEAYEVFSEDVSKIEQLTGVQW